MSGNEKIWEFPELNAKVKISDTKYAVRASIRENGIHYLASVERYDTVSLEIGDKTYTFKDREYINADIDYSIEHHGGKIKKLISKQTLGKTEQLLSRLTNLSEIIRFLKALGISPEVVLGPEDDC